MIAKEISGMGEHNSPAYADGRAAKEALNAQLQHCPPDRTSTYDPSEYGRYTIMYDRGWESVPLADLHVCARCKP
jgi:hypothetical protein